MYLFYFLVGYFALYSVIWLHEVGHGVMYAKYNCKLNPFHVQVPLYLFFSTPRPIDEERARALSYKQLFHVGIAGIVLNLLIGVPLSIVLLILEFPHTIGYFFVFSFALFHLVEAATYLVISNLFLSSDMLLVQQYRPAYRLPCMIIGLFTVLLICVFLYTCPESWRLVLVLFTSIITISMGAGRIVFTKISLSR